MKFDWFRESDLKLPEPSDYRFGSLWDMLFKVADQDEHRQSVLVGTCGEVAHSVSLGDLQSAAIQTGKWCNRNQLRRGDRIAVLRLPHASELLVAVNTLTLMANGLSVILSMECSRETADSIIADAKPRMILTPSESGVLARHTICRKTSEEIQSAKQQAGIQDCPAPIGESFLRTLATAEIPEQDPATSFSHTISDSEPDIERECLIVTTSGTTGAAKFVRYSESALLSVAESWDRAGMFRTDTLGGTSICPVFSHTMGVRNVLHAIWNRKPTLLIPPEWLDESPHRIVRLLEVWPPEHITAGPALLSSMATLAQAIPQARRATRNLRMVVSSGTAFDNRLPGSFARSNVHNAFGTTETQQILSTVCDERSGPKRNRLVSSASPETSLPLGVPLPGVAVGVRWTDVRQRVGRLFVRSRFSGTGYLGQDDFGDWIETGDLVRVDDLDLFYHGRATADFLNLGSGVKLSLASIRKRFSKLCDAFPSVTFRHSRGRMGLIAVVGVGSRDPLCDEMKNCIRQLVDGSTIECEGADDVNRSVKDREDAVEHASWLAPLVAVAVVQGGYDANGNPWGWERIAASSPGLMDALDHPSGRHPNLLELVHSEKTSDSWYRNTKPGVGPLMQSVGLDVNYGSGKGDYLVADVAGNQQSVLDLAGGYGCNLLGHSNREILDAAIVGMQRVPLLDQFSRRDHERVLADELTRQMKRSTGRDYVSLFHSTGAEAVECALKHALMKWTESVNDWIDRSFKTWNRVSPGLASSCRKYNSRQLSRFAPTLLAVDGAYHGKTLATLPLLSDIGQRKPFANWLGGNVCFVRHENLESAGGELLQRLDSSSLKLRVPAPSTDWGWTESSIAGVFAAIVEPIQGEGGIRTLTLKGLSKIQNAGIPVISDEIQCGLGRSGHFPALQNATADYYLIGKSLGGGVAKISATLIDRNQYSPEFDRHAGATFSGDAVSCCVATKVLDIIRRDDVPSRAAAIGRRLLAKLQPLQDIYPSVLRRISGQGAMLGVTFQPPADLSSLVAPLMEDQLGYIAASYLLHRHSIRILPTLSAPNTLRIQPSAYLADDGMDQLVNGLRAFCKALGGSKWLELLGHWVPRSVVEPTVNAIGGASQATNAEKSVSVRSEKPRGVAERFRFRHEAPAPGARRVGFVFNPIYPTEELLAELPDLMDLEIDQRLEMTTKLECLLQWRPVDLFSVNLFGGRVWLSGIVLPASPNSIDAAVAQSEQKMLQQRLNDAFRMATDQGCESVVFGAQTSTLTQDATSLVHPTGSPQLSPQISSGNTMTVANAIAQLDATCSRRNISAASRLGIVGVNGNIGSALLRWYAGANRWTGPITLVGRPGAKSRLEKLRNEIAAANPLARLEISQEMTDLRACDVIVAAISSNLAPVGEGCIHPTKPVVIADLSQPRAVSADVPRRMTNVFMAPAGLVRLPQDPRFKLTPHTPRGTCFACTAEAVLLGLAPQPDLRLNGEISLDAVERITELAKRHQMLST